MTAARVTGLLGASDLSFEPDDGLRRELHDGVIHVTTPAVYAEQGIPYFWRIDDGPRLQTFRLDPATGSYVLGADLGPGERGELTVPWPVTIDMVSSSCRTSAEDRPTPASSGRPAGSPSCRRSSSTGWSSPSGATGPWTGGGVVG